MPAVHHHSRAIFKCWDDSTPVGTVVLSHPQADGATCCTTGLWTSHACFSVNTQINPLFPGSLRSNAGVYLKIVPKRYLSWFILKQIGGHDFVGPLISLFWTSGEVCPGFKPGYTSLKCLLLSCNGFLRFTSDVTSIDCIEVRMTAKLFRPTYLFTNPQAWMGVWTQDKPNVPLHP